MTEILLHPAPAAAAPAEPERLDAQHLWHALMRNRLLMLGVAALVVALTAALTFVQRPVYESLATVRVEPSQRDKNPLAELVPYASNVPGEIETDLMVLHSRDVAARVVDTLGLRVSVQEPALPRARVLRLLHVPREETGGAFELTRAARGAYRVRALGNPPLPRVPATVELGQPFQVAGVELALAPELLRAPPERIRFSVSPFLRTAESLRNQIDAARPDPQARILSISYRSTDPELAAAVPNAVTAAFIQHKLEGGRAESHSTVLFLRDQVANYEGQLERAEATLRAFRERERVVSPQQEATEQVQRLAQLQGESDQMRAERDALAALLQRVQSSPPQAGGPSPYRQLASFPTFLGNRAVQDMLQALTALENQRAELLVRRTNASVDVQGIDTRIREIELQLYQMSRNYLESLDSQIASKQGVLSRFGSQLELIPAREVEFARLSRQEKLLEDLYTLLQTRLKEAEIRDAVTPADVRLIDAALVPTVPVSPRPVRNLFIGTVLGMLLGIAAALGREMLDTAVRSTDDVKTATQMPILGVIPRDRTMAPAAGRLSRIRRVPPDVFVPGSRVAMQVNPHSAVAEAFRMLRTNISYSRIGGTPQLLLVTSAMPGDGKSTSSSNLAMALAQQGTRTLLVDADLRRGTLHHLLGVPQEPGLTNVLLGRSTLAGAVSTVPAGVDGATLDVLAAGVFPPNPAELLGSPEAAALMQQLRAEYQAIVVDAPPLNLVADAAVLARLADATVLVTRPGFTDRRALHHAAAQLQQVGAPVSGVLVNDVDFESRTSAYSYGGYGYGYGYAHAGYGAYAAAGGNGRNGSNGKNGHG
jgi:capsular exopolysaccharide synthesis family protein